MVMSKIKTIKVWNADLGNTKPYTIAFKTVDEVFNVFIEITLDNDITGIGAGSPSEYVTGEQLSQTIAALHEKNLGFLIGRDIREIHQLNFEVWKKFPTTPAARAALDIALYDAFTKYLENLGAEMSAFLPKGTQKAVVKMEFIIDKDGVPTNFKIARSINEDFDDKLISKMENMGTWKPAILYDKPVPKKMVQTFTIEPL